ncbi:hypothetical protein D9M73_285910 [compost metagenome]
MSKKSREKLQAMTAAAAAAHVIANESDVQPALRLAEMQASKSTRSGTTRSASSALAE